MQSKHAKYINSALLNFLHYDFVDYMYSLSHIFVRMYPIVVYTVSNDNQCHLTTKYFIVVYLKSLIPKDFFVCFFILYVCLKMYLLLHVLKKVSPSSKIRGVFLDWYPVFLKLGAFSTVGLGQRLSGQLGIWLAG